MPRRPRIVTPGVAHHITQRGNDRQPVFFSSEDRRLYLGLLVDHATRSGTHLLGYCLMSNHIHLVAVPDREDSLARLLGRVHSEYALALNRNTGRSGHLWQNRFFSCPLDESHLVTALRYTDLNPVRAGLAVRACDWPWSSARAHMMEQAADGVLARDWAGYCGGWDYGEWTDILLAGQPEGESSIVREATRTGAPLGSQEFVVGLERQAGRRLRVLTRGRPKLPPKMPREPGLQSGLFASGE